MSPLWSTEILLAGRASTLAHIINFLTQQICAKSTEQNLISDDIRGGAIDAEFVGQIIHFTKRIEDVFFACFGIGAAPIAADPGDFSITLYSSCVMNARRTWLKSVSAKSASECGPAEA